MSKNNNSFGAWVIKYRWLIIICTFFLVAASASGIRFLGFTTDHRYFFSKENPQLKAFEALQDTYTQNDNVLFAIAPKDGKVFTRETLSVIEELTEAAWQTPYSIRVDSITNFQYTSADGDDVVVEDLVKDAVDLSDDDLERIEDIALSEPLLKNRLISSSANVTGVNITINLPGKSPGEVPEVIGFVRSMADDIRKRYPDLDLYLTGILMMNNAFMEASQNDMQRLVPVMFLAIVIIMWLLIRSFSGTFATVLVIVMSALTAMGLTGWYGIMLSPPTSIAPTIILTLAVADSIHILVAMFHEMRRGKTKHEAIIESMRINMQPVFLTSITTAIGFMSMNFSDAPPFRDLGNIVATGVTAAYLYSIFFLPAIIAVLPVRVKKRVDGERNICDSLGSFVIRWRRHIFRGMIMVVVGLTVGVTRIELNDRFVEYFDTSYKFRTDTDFVTENLTGIYQIEYSLGAGEKDGISNPEYLAKVEEFADWYRKQPGVLHVNTLTDIMKRLNRNMHGDDDSYYRLPDRRDLAAQYLLLYEMSLPFGLDLNNRINVDKSATRFTVTLKSMSTKGLLTLERNVQEWLKENAPASMNAHGASTSMMFAYIAKRNIKSMLGGTMLALILISGVLLIALRSLKIGFVSLIPNLTPAFMAFGLWGYAVGQVGMALSVVTAMSLGIVVDDTIHFLSKYLRARREHGMGPSEAVRYSFHTVGTALWVTSFILMAGFFVLSYSGFRLNSDMGLLTTIVIAFALMADFLFLPTLLIKIEEGKK